MFEAMKKNLPADRFKEGGEKITDRDKAALPREKGVAVAGMWNDDRQHNGTGTKEKVHLWHFSSERLSARLNTSDILKVISCEDNLKCRNE